MFTKYDKLKAFTKTFKLIALTSSLKLTLFYYSYMDKFDYVTENVLMTIHSIRKTCILGR